MYTAYDSLSQTFKEMIRLSKASMMSSLSADFPRSSPELQAQRRQNYPPVVHPVVRVHPELEGKPFFAGGFLRNFVGMTAEETKPLSDFLNRHATRYEFVYRHAAAADLLMWGQSLCNALSRYRITIKRHCAACKQLAPGSRRQAIYMWSPGANRMEPAGAGRRCC